MATIYRFVVEQKGRGGGGGKPRANKGAGKKGKDLPLFGGDKGGVEHNRKMRAINPILNKVTGGVWEKGMRLGRAAGGLVKVNSETGKITVGGPSIAIIIAMILITIWNTISKYNQQDRAIAEKTNTQNYVSLENGTGAIHGAYKVVTNYWSGKISYNENK